MLLLNHIAQGVGLVPPLSVAEQIYRRIAVDWLQSL